MTAEWCTICGERITEQDKKNGNYAEMYDPKHERLYDYSAFLETPRPLRHADHSGIVHAECGLQNGWEQA